MDRVPDGILIMLKDLEDYIVSAGLADMMASADIITQVSTKYLLFFPFKNLNTLFYNYLNGHSM